jgi:hypothetical protein
LVRSPLRLSGGNLFDGDVMDARHDEDFETVGFRIPKELRRKMDQWVAKSPSLCLSDCGLIALSRFFSIPREQQDSWMAMRRGKADTSGEVES